MVSKVFTLEQDSSSATGWKIKTNVDSRGEVVLDLPTSVKECLNGKYIKADDMLKKISTIKIALAGVTNSLNIEKANYLDNNSAIQSFGLATSGTIDDEIDGYIEASEEDQMLAIRTYESFHTVKMDRDKSGDDNSIHAYLYTPKDGRLRCVFDKSIRLDARRNNVSFWVDNYRIDSGSSGGKFVRIIGQPIEIM
jgi:hypothetical protein